MLRTYAVAIVTFFALDLLWLGVVAKGFYRTQMGHLLRPDVQWGPALLFYLIFVAALVVFVVQPAMEKQSLRHALLYGAFFGLATYAAYDLTNLALAKDFPTIVAVVDLAWGAVLSATVAAVGYKFG
ncbi:MAG TPA: DUF2177 family protein [Gemmatimonadales bacterium]|nr:DUF2177 family protein [Gemmatimonadales bacterium]